MRKILGTSVEIDNLPEAPDPELIATQNDDASIGLVVRAGGKVSPFTFEREIDVDAAVLALIESHPDIEPKDTEAAFGASAERALRRALEERPLPSKSVLSSEGIAAIARRAIAAEGLESVAGVLPGIMAVMRRRVSIPARVVAVLARLLQRDFKMPALGFRRGEAGPPRRDWGSLRPDLFFPPMNLDWLKGQAEVGLLGHLKDLRYAIPKEAVEAHSPSGVYGLVYDMIGLGFEREGVGEPVEAPAVLAEALSPDTRRFPVSETSYLSAAEKRDEWLAHTILNGKYPMPLTADGSGRYTARWLYSDLAFGDELGRPARTYELPDLTAQLDVRDDGVHLGQIAFRYRRGDDAAYRRGGDEAYEPWQTVDMRPGQAEVWRQERAKRVLAGAILLTAQIDQHVARGHLVPEVYSVAVRRYLAEDHPIRTVLMPRLDEVDVVNFNADALIWGKYGLLCCASAITSEGFAKRFRDRLAGMDWKGFAPRSRSVHSHHYAPLIHKHYWDEVVVPYVVEALKPLADAWDADTNGYRQQALAMFDAVRLEWPQFEPWDAVARSAWLDASEFADGTPGTSAFSAVRSFEDVQAAVAFCLYHATMAHSWPNVRQLQAGGDPDFASFGLRKRIDDPEPANIDDTAWQSAASAFASDQLYALTVGHVLTELPVDTFERELRGVMAGDYKDHLRGTPDALAARFEAERSTFKALAAQSRFHGRRYLEDTRAHELIYQLSRANR